jgi:hypothetical protein
VIETFEMGFEVSFGWGHEEGWRGHGGGGLRIRG